MKYDPFGTQLYKKDLKELYNMGLRVAEWKLALVKNVNIWRGE